jgi:Lar family restriction alleviation protein
MTTEALKPCPFCGAKDAIYPGYRRINGELAPAPYQIDCCGCGIDFEPRMGMDVIAAWNRRAGEQK